MQNDRVRRTAMVATVLLASAIIACAGPLDGTKWKVKVVPNKAATDKGEKEFDDELSFADGQFTSKALLAKGFKPTKYNGDIEPNEAEFEVEQLSETNGVANWLGDIRGTNTAGRLLLMKKGLGNFSYDFEGTKK